VSAFEHPRAPRRVAIFAPHPLLTVTIEPEGADRHSIHFHAGGQGVWVARPVATLGAQPVLCGFIGGESGGLLHTLLERIVGAAQLRLVQTAAASGCYVTDRRSGERELLAMTLSDPPSRHEMDELFSLACAEAIECGWLVVTNPMPGSTLPIEVYGDLVGDAKANGARVLVDLSSPRLDSALRGEPDVVKLNDWELAGYVRGPVDTDARLLSAAGRIQEAGAATVVVTRGEQPALVLHEGVAWQLTPPRFEKGFREGCGDTMMGAMAAQMAGGAEIEQALAVGAAAGAANFLRHGLGNVSREVVEQLAEVVRLDPWPLARSLSS
jgi:1-phosphofructokinase